MSDSNATDWIDRCAQRICDIDPEVDATAALELAREIAQFPRTAAMAPEFAVDFVASELQQPTPRFDRRRTVR